MNRILAVTFLSCVLVPVTNCHACWCDDPKSTFTNADVIFEGTVVESYMVRDWFDVNGNTAKGTTITLYSTGLPARVYEEHVFEVSIVYRGDVGSSVTIQNMWNSCRAMGFRIGQRMIVSAVRDAQGNLVTHDCLLTKRLGPDKQLPEHYEEQLKLDPELARLVKDLLASGTQVSWGPRSAALRDSLGQGKGITTRGRIPVEE